MERSVTVPPATRRPLRRHRWPAILGLLCLCGCAALRLTAVERASLLQPRPVDGDAYQVEGDAVTYHNGDLRVVVEALSDAQLNRQFAEESSLGEYSINPYTFGNWVDPQLGYVPNRFTVFRVTVHNEGFAKVRLNPLRAVLTTDRPGEALPAYGILAGSAPRTFEGYYRARRRPSGNEYYRFNMRMGIVRSNNYGVDEMVFDGETYGGFIVFDPLDESVRRVRLVLHDFALKFSAFDAPLETVDLAFEFDRRIDVGQRIRTDVDVESPWSEARLRAPSRVEGRLAGDAARDAGAIDAVVDTHMDAANACFEPAYRAGDAAEGRVDLTYGVNAEGRVTDVAILRSTVVSSEVEGCLEAAAGGWDFGPSAIPAAARADEDYVVTVQTSIEFLDVRETR